MRQSLCLLIAMTGLLPAAIASTTPSSADLGCRVQAGKLSVGLSVPKKQLFVWEDREQEETPPPEQVDTSVGVFRKSILDAHSFRIGTTTVDLPADARGKILFGNVYELGNRIAVAYMVKVGGEEKVSASEAVVIVERDASVSDYYVLAGSLDPPPSWCYPSEREQPSN